MARIRTIKPEIWSSPQFVESSTSARLLFISALNFASDFGVLDDSAMKLKLQCFPGDTYSQPEIEGFIHELVEHGLWSRREAPNGDQVLLITKFSEHQKIDRKSKGKWGDPTQWPEIRRGLDEGSTTARRGLDDGREGKGREGIYRDNPPNPPDGGNQVEPLQEFCDRCQAEPDRPCKDRTGANRTTPHSTRTREPNWGTPIPPEDPPAARHDVDCPGGCDGNNWIQHDDGVTKCEHIDLTDKATA